MGCLMKSIDVPPSSPLVVVVVVVEEAMLLYTPPYYKRSFFVFCWNVVRTQKKMLVIWMMMANMWFVGLKNNTI